ncbi:MAG TPA: ammonium transporter [Candidatus Binatia bacterium]|jgi:Amt family ammonium transporter
MSARTLRLAMPTAMLLIAASAAPAAAGEAPGISAGDSAWMLAACALVLLMTPGLALFYGGMVRSKNVLSSLMHSYVAMGVVSVQWVVCGYSLAFAPGGPFIGGLSHLMLHGVHNDVAWPGTAIPQGLFMAFQMMFAIITPALVSGAVAERVKFSSWVLFLVLWATLVYDPVCHWVWASDGWLMRRGVLDFAGGTVVHVSSGVSALALTLVLGRRIGYPHTPMKPHNLAMTLFGAGLLWFGWYGFNGGSALGANSTAVGAFIATHIAAAAAATTWCLIEARHRGKASALGFATGALAGLVAITPACGYVDATGALVIGAVGASLCYAAVLVKRNFGYDDTLDVFGVHGVGGAWGAIATGIFCIAALTPDRAGGLIDRANVYRVAVQATGVAATFAYAFLMTLVLARVLDAGAGLRIDEEGERSGLDLASHGETGYDF